MGEAKKRGTPEERAKAARLRGLGRLDPTEALLRAQEVGSLKLRVATPPEENLSEFVTQYTRTFRQAFPLTMEQRGVLLGTPEWRVWHERLYRPFTEPKTKRPAVTLAVE